MGLFLKNKVTEETNRVQIAVPIDGFHLSAMLSSTTSEGASDACKKPLLLAERAKLV